MAIEVNRRYQKTINYRHAGDAVLSTINFLFFNVRDFLDLALQFLPVDRLCEMA